MNAIGFIIMFWVYVLIIYSRYQRRKRKYDNYSNPALYFEKRVEVMNAVLEADYDRKVTAMREGAAAIRADADEVDHD